MSKQRKAFFIAAGLGLISVFLPWVSVGSFGSVNGTRGDGLIALIGIVIIGLITVLGNLNNPVEKKLLMANGILFGLMALIALVDMVNLSNVSSKIGAMSSMVSLGLGLPLLLISGLAGAAIAFLKLYTPESRVDFLK